MSNSKIHIAVRFLHHITRSTPELWRLCDVLRAQRTWPDYVFVPEAAVLGTGIPISEIDLRQFIAMASWRPTQGIYRFAPALLDALCETPVSGAIPGEVLRRIPEWCVYIEIEREVNGHLLHGAFAHLDLREDGEVLRLAILHDHNAVFSVPVPIMRTIDEALANCQPDDSVPPNLLHLLAHRKSFVERVVSLLLYLCSTNAEIRDPKASSRAPGLAKSHIDRHGRSRWYAARDATIWETGTRLGAALDAAKARSTSKTSAPTGRTVRPHVRRAHWHHVWIGPRDEPEKRKRELKWWNPILVNFGDGEEPDAATIRTVEGTR